MASPISAVTDSMIKESILLHDEAGDLSIDVVSAELHVRRSRVQKFVAAYRDRLKEENERKRKNYLFNLADNTLKEENRLLKLEIQRLSDIFRQVQSILNLK